VRDNTMIRLAQAGVPVGHLTRAQQEVVLGLTEAEFSLLTGVLHRMNGVDPDVEGQDLVVML
jgi:hypothetical protein